MLLVNISMSSQNKRDMKKLSEILKVLRKQNVSYTIGSKLPSSRPDLIIIDDISGPLCSENGILGGINESTL